MKKHLAILLTLFVLLLAGCKDKKTDFPDITTTLVGTEWRCDEKFKEDNVTYRVTYDLAFLTSTAFRLNGVAYENGVKVDEMAGLGTYTFDKETTEVIITAGGESDYGVLVGDKLFLNDLVFQRTK